ncbi:hypothetical protein Pint_33970 [Pistacia integerrima]|uniref:Uncharacterized protein n=1 Tax=Pistacia integerrima TaxID=434235 RepID=A0ACC0X7B5_9ROSI|nr:hypothetical protein Pint_33970 [Pistacia integerrima]
MAFATFHFPNITPLVSVKLDGSNYLNWITQFTPLLRSHDLLGIVDGSESCPPKFATDSEGKTTSDITTDYMVWQKKDQFILAWINATLMEKVLSTVYGQNTSRQILNQGAKSCTSYLVSAKNWPNQLAAVGKPVDDEDLISYVVGDTHNDAFFSHKSKLPYNNSKPKPFSANKPTVPRSSNTSNFSAHPPNNPNFSVPPIGKGPTTSNNTFFSHSKPPCQICGKTNHQALDCYHRMDFSYQRRHPPAQLATMAAHTHVTQEEDQPWFLGSGANTHVTSALNNLTLTQQPYQGPTKVTVGNGGGLLSITPLCQDNNCYFTLTATSFVVKELQTNKILLQGPSRAGLYPIYFQPFNSNKRQHNSASNFPFTAFLGVTAPAITWHA